MSTKKKVDRLTSHLLELAQDKAAAAAAADNVVVLLPRDAQYSPCCSLDTQQQHQEPSSDTSKAATSEFGRGCEGVRNDQFNDPAGGGVRVLLLPLHMGAEGLDLSRRCWSQSMNVAQEQQQAAAINNRCDRPLGRRRRRRLLCAASW